MDPDVQRRGRGRAVAPVRPRQPGRGRVLAGQGHAARGPRRPVRGPRGAPRDRPGRLALRGAVRRAARGPDGLRGRHGGRARPGLRAPGRAVERGRRGRGHRHRAHRARLRRRGLPAGQGARPAGHRAARRIGHRPRRVRVAVRSGRARCRRSDHRAPQARRPLPPARDDHPPLSALLAVRDAARLPPRGRVVHQHGPAVRPATRDADDGAGRREPALPDHGCGRPDPVDPGLRLRARARLAPQHARLDDQQEALLGAGAADLRLRRVRDRRGHRRPRTSSTSVRSRAGTSFDGHTPHRPFVDAVKIACPGCGGPVERIKDVGNPWLDAGIVPFSTLHFREDPEYWAKWFPADFITESFPGQFRNWFYSMLAMSTVLRREEPFRTIFGYALVFGEDGRPMHKSWGNAIDFDEAAERMGVDVMRWMFANARPEDNILFGWHAADEARRELLVLWNVYAFFVTYARLVGWTAADAAPPVSRRRALDRWILSRAAGTAAVVEDRLRDVDAIGATRALSAFMSGLSTWYLRLSRRRFSRSDDAERSRSGVRHAPRGADRHDPDARADPAVPVRGDVRQPRDGPRRCARQRPPDAVPDGRPGGAPRRASRGGDGGRPGGRGPGPDPAQLGPAQDPTAIRQGLARPAGPRPRRGRRAAGDHRERDQRQVGRADQRRFRPHRATGQAAAAEDRQAPRVGDPGRHGGGPRRRRHVRGGRLGDAGRRDPRSRRGRDPGDAPAGDRRRRGRRARAGPRYGTDAGAAGRWRRPRAPAGGPGPAQGCRARARRPDRALGGRPVGRRGGAPRRGRRGDPRRARGAETRRPRSIGRRSSSKVAP